VLVASFVIDVGIKALMGKHLQLVTQISEKSAYNADEQVSLRSIPCS